jgi:hypothetical protein
MNYLNVKRVGGMLSRVPASPPGAARKGKSRDYLVGDDNA